MGNEGNGVFEVLGNFLPGSFKVFRRDPEISDSAPVKLLGVFPKGSIASLFDPFDDVLYVPFSLLEGTVEGTATDGKVFLNISWSCDRLEDNFHGESLPPVLL